MIEKFFLALDYRTDDEVIKNGLGAVNFLETEFGKDFVIEQVGVKLNGDLVIGPIDTRYVRFKTDRGCAIFADMKVSHGYDTGERIIDRLCRHLPIDYITVSANLGLNILKEYVRSGTERGVRIIASTVHTKTSPEDALRMYRQPLADAIYNLAQMASKAGCDAVVLEGAMLRDERIRNLPIKKLVTGIRLDPSDLGTQKRVTAVEELVKLKPCVDYAVISSKNVSNLRSLEEILCQLM